MRNLTAIWITAIILTGCISEPEGPPNQEGPPSEQPPPPTGPAGTAAPPIGNGTLPSSAFFSDCIGVYSYFTWPLKTNPGQAPPGWEPGEDQVASDSWLMFMDCIRFNWGPVERGPIQFLLDFHNSGTVPENCGQGDPPFTYWTLSAAWTSDAEVAEYLRRTEGLPIGVGEFIHAEQMGEVATADWTWTLDGQLSTLHLDQPSPGEQEVSLFPKRIFWMNGTKISHLQLPQTYTSPGPTDGITQAELSGPMTMADNPPAYVGRGGLMTGSYEGEIRRYNDLVCD